MSPLPVAEDFSAPRANTTPQQLRRTPKAKRQTFARQWTIIWAVALVFGFILSTAFGAANVKPANAVFDVAASVALASVVIPWAIYLVVKLYKSFAANLNAAMKPVPNPAEISWGLQQEWGRQPTVQEVAAVQQMLTSERNQSLLNSGITLGALYLMDRNLHD